jgi:hypothetical protein
MLRCRTTVYALLVGMNPDTLEFIVLVKCGLIGGCVKDIFKFIARRARIGVGLRAFEVSPSEVPDADRRRIAFTAYGKAEDEEMELAYSLVTRCL